MGTPIDSTMQTLTAPNKDTQIKAWIIHNLMTNTAHSLETLIVQLEVLIVAIICISRKLSFRAFS